MHPASLQNRALADVGFQGVKPTKTFVWDVGFQLSQDEYPNPGLYAYLNNISFSASPAPSLLERLTNNPEGLGPPVNAVPASPGGNVRGWNVMELAGGDVVQVVLNNLNPCK